MMIIAVWSFQVAFAVIIILDAVKNDEFVFSEPPEIKIGLTRYVCGMIMHIMCNIRIKNGMKMMKYSVNHWWKFRNYRIAFLAGFLQTLAMVLIALINYAVITIESDVIGIAKDFTALFIIAEFSDIFGKFGTNEELAKKVCTEKKYRWIFKIETTTSNDAEDRQDVPMEEDWVYEKMKERPESQYGSRIRP